MNLSVIIAYYKALDNLRVILSALNQQSSDGFEVIIAEDDNNEETLNFLEDNKELYHFPIIHINQECDMGFRKNMMLNMAIRKSNAEMLVFIDGDCIPHRHFVKEYIRNSEAGFILWGRRVMLGQQTSLEVLKNHSIQGYKFMAQVMSDSKSLKSGIYSPYMKLSIAHRGIWGCNWGVRKQHMLDVNGYDEDYVSPTVGEDMDIEWRLLDSGLKAKSMKNKAIVYHLDHPRGYSDEGVALNLEMLRAKQEANHIVCLNGLEKLSNSGSQ